MKKPKSLSERIRVAREDLHYLQAVKQINPLGNIVKSAQRDWPRTAGLLAELDAEQQRKQVEIQKLEAKLAKLEKELEKKQQGVQKLKAQKVLWDRKHAKEAAK